MFNRAYEALKGCWDHPYNKVRIQIAKTMDCLMAFDVEYSAEKWNMGGSYPTRARAVDDLGRNMPCFGYFSMRLSNSNYINCLFAQMSRCVDGQNSM